jgi:hypothetical protein
MPFERWQLLPPTRSAKKQVNMFDRITNRRDTDGIDRQKLFQCLCWAENEPSSGPNGGIRILRALVALERVEKRAGARNGAKLNDHLKDGVASILRVLRAATPDTGGAAGQRSQRPHGQCIKKLRPRIY